MGLGKRNGSEELGLGLGFVRYTRSMSGKRIAISSNMEVDSTVNPQKMKKQWSEMDLSSDKSLLEALPQHIVVRILCGVGHDDLKQLVLVSKQIREATLEAKKSHFAFSTPTKSLAFRGSKDLGNVEKCFEEFEAPNAPKQIRSHRSRLNGKKLANISVALFASPDEKGWPKKDLFTKMETSI